MEVKKEEVRIWRENNMEVKSEGEEKKGVKRRDKDWKGADGGGR